MEINRFYPRRLFVLAFSAALAATEAHAAPRDELLRLVPDSMDFCLVVQDVREHFGNENSFFSRVMQVPFVRAKLELAEVKKFKDMKDQIFRDLQIAPEQIRDDLLGDAVVFAYRQGPMEQDQGMFLLWARDKALLVKAANQLNELQQKSGELKELNALTHMDRPYFRRIKVKGKETTNEFYFIRDNLLVVTSQETMIKAAIERDGAEPAADKQTPFWSRMLTRLGFGKAVAALLANPRGFDQQLKDREAEGKADGKAFVKEFRKYWDAFDGLGIAAIAGHNFELDFAVSYRPKALPQLAQRFFAQHSKPSALWRAIPPDALFAASSRIDFELLTELFASFCDEARFAGISRSIRQWMGPFRDELATFKKGLGPDWGFWAFAPAATDKTWVPQMLLAVKLQDAPQGPAAEAAVRKVVDFVAAVAQFGNKDQPSVKSLTHNKTEIKVFTSEKRLPAGFRPAFATKDGYVMFAGAPEAIQRFKLPQADEVVSAETPLVRLSATGWKDYLAQHKTDVVKYLASRLRLTPKEAEERVDLALENLKPFDRLEVLTKGRMNQATLVIRLTMTPAK